MAHRQAKLRAFGLFAANLWPADVAAELKINLRTSQRWFAEWKSQNVATSQTANFSADTAAESQRLIEQTLSTVKSKGVREWSQKWEEAAIALSDELLLYHRQMRRRMMQIWAEEARKPDINTRILNSLSQQVCRHSEIEISIQNLALLNLDKAAKTLDSFGYLILDPRLQDSEEK